MLLWINGPFGGGDPSGNCPRTRSGTACPAASSATPSTPASACAVCSRPNCAEPAAGARGRRPLIDVFQELASWRRGVVEVLDLALTRHEGVVIAP